MDIEAMAVALLDDTAALRYMYDEGVHEEHFFGEYERRSFVAAMEYFLRHGRLELAPSREVLMEGVEGYAAILMSMEGVALEPVTYVVEELKKKYTRTKLEEMIGGIGAEEFRNDPDAAVSSLFDGTADVKMSNMRKADSIVYAEDIEYQDKVYRERHEDADDKGMGVPWPISEMNDVVGQLRKKEVATLAALPGTGKTWFLCLFAYTAAEYGWNVYFASLEMDTPEITERIDVIAAGDVSPFRYDIGEIMPEERKKIRDARKKVNEFPGKIVVEQPLLEDSSPVSLATRARMHQADIIMIDQLMMMRRPDAENRTVSIEMMMKELKDSVKSDPDNPLACLLASQFKRGKEKAGVGEASDIAMSTAVEQLSDFSIGMGRSSEMENAELMNLGFNKTRRGIKGEWTLKWQLMDRFDISVESSRTWTDETATPLPWEVNTSEQAS